MTYINRPSSVQLLRQYHSDQWMRQGNPTQGPAGSCFGLQGRCESIWTPYQKDRLCCFHTPIFKRGCNALGGDWLTLDIHSALEAVGLTATVARALTRAAIPCNVIAAYHHDHLLVPADRADEAILVLEGVASEPDRSD